jgi:uncharacterized membrane protein HdeD (DUF308 family)
MKNYLHYIGILLILLGVFILALTHLSSFACNNTLLITGLLFIITGIVAHIHVIKSECS